MRRITKILSLVTLFVTLISQGQTGKVTGKVIDGEFNDALSFANILVKGTSIGTTSDFDGKYTLELEPGTYALAFSFVGYETKEISDLIIQPNQVVDLDVTLKTNTNALETIVITTSVKKNTESAVLSLQKKSVTLLDGLSAQSIKKSGAGNAASAIKSVPGVSVQGGKYVYVRGLGDRYTKSILNGVDIPGLDPDRNTIQMDIFPTNIIDNVIVIKSASAEYPADFTGGVVDIVTKDFPTKETYSISLGTGYNSKMHFNDKYLTYDGSKSDFLGYDSGKRDRPIHRYQPIPLNNSLLTTLTNTFDKELAAKEETSDMNFSFGLTAGNQFELGDNKLGYLASLSYKNNTEFYENKIDGNYQKQPETSIFEPGANRYSLGNEGINNVTLNGLLGLSFKTENSKYRLNVMHIQNGETTSGFYKQTIYEAGPGAGAVLAQKDALLYTERAISNLLLSGKHNINEGFDFEWKFSPTLTGVQDKDHRISPLVQAESGNYTINASTAGRPTRIWRTLQEESWVGKVDFSNKYDLFEKPAKVKFGGSYVFKYRDFSIDNFVFDTTFTSIENADVDTILSPENIWTVDSQSGSSLVSGQRFNPTNAYEGEQNVGAFYVSNEFNVTDKFKAVLGLRSEMFKLYYTGVNTANEELKGAIMLDELDLFPSANFIYAATEKANLRASYSRTTARPSFKEASNIQISDPISNRLFLGNGFGIEDENGGFIFEAVNPSYINNFDLRYEVFREAGQMVALSAFYKDFTDPIETVFLPTAPGQYTVANLGNANVYGLEFEFRQNLGFLTEGLKDLKFNANVSVIQSKLKMGEKEYSQRLVNARDGESIDEERELQGQSPYLINVGLDYSHSDNGLQAGLYYNVQGKSLEVVGTGIVPDVYTQPFHSLNFTASKTFGEKKNSSISFKATNLLGSERLSEYESFNASNQTYAFKEIGTELSLGYSYKF